MKVKNSDQDLVGFLRISSDFLQTPVSVLNTLVNFGGERADVSTTEGTNSEALPKKEKKK